MVGRWQINKFVSFMISAASAHRTDVSVRERAINCKSIFHHQTATSNNKTLEIFIDFIAGKSPASTDANHFIILWFFFLSHGHRSTKIIKGAEKKTATTSSSMKPLMFGLLRRQRPILYLYWFPSKIG